MEWPRWLGVSVAVHAVVITGIWVASQTMRRSPLPEPPASVMAVALVDPQDGDSALPAAAPVPPLIAIAAIAPEPPPSQPSPDPAPDNEDVPPEPRPEVTPYADPSPQNPNDLIEASPPVAPAPAEPAPDAAAGHPPSTAHEAETAAHAQYRPLVLAILERAKRYPLLAQRRGLEGTVEIEFLIGADGRISDPQVIVPSPHRVLDAATLALVHRIGSLPPPPDRTPLRFPVRIEYTLESIASPISTEGARP